MLRLLATIALLAYASWQDLKTREIEERVWVALCVVGILGTGYDAFVARDIFIFLRMAAVASGTFIVMFILYRIGLFGFADVEALVALSTVYPFRPGFIMPFPLSVFNNAVLITALLPVGILAYNLWRGANFDSIDDAWYKKVVLLFVGYRTPLARLDENNFPLVWGKKIRLFVPIEYNFPEYIKKAEEEGVREIWMTPGIPFILSLTLGFLLAYFWGDAILELVFLLLR